MARHPISSFTYLNGLTSSPLTLLLPMPLLSMTGFGDARHERENHSLSAEVRTINNRHLKLNLRSTEGYAALDSRIEAVVRQFVRRGTVNVNIRIRHLSAAEDYRVNLDVLGNYIDQLQKLA